MRIKKSLLVIIGTFTVFTALLVYNYVYQDHRDIESEVPAFIVSAAELSKAFAQDEQEATVRYLNKTLLVTGPVRIQDEQTVMMGTNIFFALGERNKRFPASISDEILKIKGRCIGYDTILEEIKFDQAVIIN